MLNIQNLSVRYKGRKKPAVEKVSLRIKKGEIAGLVGESGSGKSTIANSVLNILPDDSSSDGIIEFNSRSLQNHEREIFLSKKIAYIGQNFYKSLSDYFTMETHYKYFFKSIFNRRANEKDIEKFKSKLKTLKLEEPDKLIDKYPFELSGGMLQRFAIAFSLLKDPQLLIADEPTSAIDMAVKQEFINLLNKKSKEKNMAVLLISHDLNLIFEFCNTVYVLYKGKVVEHGNSINIHNKAAHPYTRLLVDSEEPIKFSEKDENSITKSCVFAQYCPYFKAGCTDEIRKISEDHFVACKGTDNA